VTRAADRAFLDTNVLLSATDKGRARHGAALTVLDEWPGEGVTLYSSAQILREYLCVATRSRSHNGLALAAPDAIANVRSIRGRVRLLDGGSKVADRLLELLADIECAGKRVHDANVVATMLVHGIGTLVTENAEDFRRFSDRIEIVSP
jgi:predicted nucleic acid-binding protein